MCDESSRIPDRLDALRERVREFVAHQVVPAEDALDAGDRDTRSRLRDRAVEAGLWALPLPVEYGGGGLRPAEYFALAEVEGRSDHGPDALGSAALLNVRMLAAHAHPELRDALLPGVVSGALSVGYAMTEPGVPGSDPEALRTRAVREGAEWRVSGRKWFTTGAAGADYVLVVARTGDGPARAACSILAVPTAAPGFRVVRELDVLGVGGQYEIAMDEVLVPDTHLIGPVGGALALAGARLAVGRTLRALRWVGQAQRAVELMAARAGQRRLGGGTLADRQLVQQMVFDAELAVRSARLFAARAAELVAADETAQIEVSMAKVAAARALTVAADNAIQVYGAEGLTAATGLPRLLRVARAARILDGADEFHVSSTARRLIRSYQPIVAEIGG
ncbi:acyl-CoA/acyl-ACP dehydrogenase [Nocardia sp. NEAU-G5]|uniref:Acyl-CoA/acyl-ACP dehydrogenase n=1 Tax=Nocardia albiluteola TaxID=2842303 RepID=A0ABS6B6H0_9NOCA|nr:acyl-CoA dehydrogenase family protein [Nocardia albiluteola]MBU3065913.1 acyl-CoA/acyl-ACP dehydrogenase [Nocardia albiluteola]